MRAHVCAGLRGLLGVLGLRSLRGLAGCVAHASARRLRAPVGDTAWI